jgi:cytidine deaminase
MNGFDNLEPLLKAFKELNPTSAYLIERSNIDNKDLFIGVNAETSYTSQYTKTTCAEDVFNFVRWKIYCDE